MVIMNENLKRVQNCVKTELIKLLPDRKLYDNAETLIIKHGNLNYLIKINPEYDNLQEVEEIIYIKKTNINYDNIKELCNSVIGKFLIFDVTEFNLNVVHY